MAIDWQTWRHVDGAVTWRMAEKADRGALFKLRRAMEARLGKQDNPDLFESPVMLCLVAEDEHGTIVDGIYIEAVAEVTKLSLSPHGYSLTPILASFLAARKIRVGRVTIPRKLRRLMRPMLELMGLDCVDDQLSHFAYKIQD